MVSTNLCPLCGTYFYVNWHTKFKCKNILFGMVDHIKNNSQWARSKRSLLLTGHWNYWTQDDQMDHALPQDIATIQINFEEKWYKIFGLIGMTN